MIDQNEDEQKIHSWVFSMMKPNETENKNNYA